MSSPPDRKKRPTQLDVARHAGVAQTTVSKVLNNSSTISVPATTRQRILAAVEELGYAPDTAARRLRTRKTYTIASIIPDITNPFYPAVERGIQDVAERFDYDLIVYNTDGVARKEHKCLRSLQEGRVDGVIASLFHLRAMDLRPLLERNVPVVRLEARAQETGSLPLDNLYVDSVAAAHAAVSYLIGRGYHPIAAIGSASGPGPLRRLGYQNALAEHGLPFDAALFVEADFTDLGGYTAMRELLARPQRPRAVFAANDLMAMGALMALNEAGQRVPEDVAVVGFDDIATARLVSPPLTTISLFQEQLGRRAAELLFERLQGQVPEGGRSEEMPFQLIQRASA
jgi:LacI family transcriptional regulator